MRTASRFTKVAISAGLVVATGAGVLGITSFASAQLAQPGAVVTTTDGMTTTTDTATGDERSTEVESQSSATAPHVSAGSVAAAALGMTEAELRTELSAGKSIAQVAEAKGVALQTVIDALVDAREAHIAAHVAEGKLTQAEADRILADLETRVTEMVNKTGLPSRDGHGGRGGRGMHGHLKAASEQVASVLKLTVDELRTQLRDGKSLAQIAEAQDVDIADVKAALTAEFKAHLAEEVASGEHTQAEADAKLARFESRLDEMVNAVRPEGGRGGRGHGSRDGHHGPAAPQTGDAPAAEGTSL
jgi:hypothetical protein